MVIAREPISRIETRLSVPNAISICVFSNAFGVSSDWILSTQNTNTPQFNINNSEVTYSHHLQKWELLSQVS